MTDKILEAIEKRGSGKPNSANKATIKEFYETMKKNDAAFLGYLMNIGFDEATVITNDFFKMKNGGVPKNSFLLILPDSFSQDDFTFEAPSHLILARVLEPVTTPLSADVSRTYFEMHKNQMPEIDVFTKSDLQWSAMKVAILGTYYDKQIGEIGFGGDIESYMSPHMYSVYVPSSGMLEILINSFVEGNKLRLGSIRLTETQMNSAKGDDVVVYTSPDDFIGSRTAFFGKTRMGKSNTVKKIVQMILDSARPVGQVIFDLNGEYAYKNEQDETSIYDLYKENCIRYTLRDNPEKDVQVLKANFFDDLDLGFSILKHLYPQLVTNTGDYEKAFLDWEVLPADELNKLKSEDRSAYTRYERHTSIYRTILKSIKFETNGDPQINLHLKKEIREAVANAYGMDDIPERVLISNAVDIYTKVWQHFIDNSNNPMYTSRTSGKPYWDETAKSMLTMLTGVKETGNRVSGARKLIPFRKYHDLRANDVINSILSSLEKNKCVIIDMSNAPEELCDFYATLVSTRIFNRQMEKFTSNKLGNQFVQFFFEEAHNLFPSNDANLKNIYNRLAKEGAKLQIGVGYSTQSISSLSPDLLKNTENFFIAHLNDQREIKELTRFYEFQDVGYDVQRTKSQGFVRMITRSHKFALPVQIDKFEAKK